MGVRKSGRREKKGRRNRKREIRRKGRGQGEREKVAVSQGEGAEIKSQRSGLRTRPEDASYAQKHIFKGQQQKDVKEGAAMRQDCPGPAVEEKALPWQS